MSKKDLSLKLQNPFRDYIKEFFSADKFKNSIGITAKNLPREKKEYQVVIMAAGKSSRMNIDYPKTLYKFNYPGKNCTILANTLNLISKLPQKVSKVFVVIRDEDAPFYDKLKNTDNVEFIKLNSNQIKGTANCLLCIKQYLQKDLDILMFWGDLVLIPKFDVVISVDMHNILKNSLTFPTRYKLNPYVAFIRDENGKIIEIAHKNEGKNFTDWAEQDCSFFIFNYSLFTELAKFIDNRKLIESGESKEIDFVHFILFLTSSNKRICPIPISNDNYVYDINTIESAKNVQKKLDEISKPEFERIFLSN